MVIVHGLRRWYERRGVLRQEGQRVSLHYYDLHCLFRSGVGRAALAQAELGVDCVRHPRMFFDRPDYDLASAVPGSFAIAPTAGSDLWAALRLFDIERRSLKEAAEILSIFLTGGEDLGKKEHQLFGEDGFESMMDRVASIEKTLGIYELAQFTPSI